MLTFGLGRPRRLWSGGLLWLLLGRHLLEAAGGRAAFAHDGVVEPHVQGLGGPRAALDVEDAAAPLDGLAPRVPGLEVQQGRAVDED